MCFDFFLGICLALYRILKTSLYLVKYEQSFVCIIQRSVIWKFRNGPDDVRFRYGCRHDFGGLLRIKHI